MMSLSLFFWLIFEGTDDFHIGITGGCERERVAELAEMVAGV